MKFKTHEIEREGKKFTVLEDVPGMFFSDPTSDDPAFKSKDTDGEYFAGDTWTGDEYGINRKFVFYDHADNAASNPYAEYAPPDPVVGVAEFVRKDSRARWFNFEIEKANAYHDFIMDLNEYEFLGLSSRTVKGVKKSAADGRILKWPEVELSLTVMPADPRTRYLTDDQKSLVEKSFKSHVLPRLEKKSAEVDIESVPETPVVTEGEKGVDGPVSDAGTTEEPQKDGSFYISIDGKLDDDGVAGVLNAAAAGTNTTEDPAGEMSQEDMIQFLTRLLEDAINPWKMKVDLLEAEIKSLKDLNIPDILKDHKKGIETVYKALDVKKAAVIAKASDQEIASIRGSVPEAKTTEQESNISLLPRQARSAFGKTAPGSH